ncbi:MAG: chemotaxis protein CheD [Bacteroidetes bacterium]|nr:MAG: chemotaxis protein CheD [Bacteroidota bacterium]
MMVINTHFLYPASLFVDKKPFLVNTILGSCVAVCLWDKVLKIGGINHFMLPLWNGEGLASPKYGNIAIEKLLNEMFNLGCKRYNLIAKVFGGGAVIETKTELFNIGTRNIKIAIDLLKDEKIPIVAKSVGGELGRRMQFNTQTGEVKMKYIQKQSCQIPNIKLAFNKGS